jgi:cadmium resistance protein CadD (predicted permease)
MWRSSEANVHTGTPAAAVTLANGGDNIGVYVPAFAATGIGALITYVIVFLLLVAVWCVAGWWIASRPVVAQVLTRWGDLILPVVLITNRPDHLDRRWSVRALT